MSRQHTPIDRTQEAAGEAPAPAHARQENASVQEHYREQSLAEIGRMYGGAPAPRRAGGEQATGFGVREAAQARGAGAHGAVTGAGGAPLLDEATATGAGAGRFPDEAVRTAAPGGVVGGKSGADWGDPRERVKSPDFRGVALTRPAGEVQIPLGHRHRQAYWIGHADLAPEGTSFTWRHSIRGSAAVSDEVLSGQTAEGASHELHVQPKVPGKKRIASTAIQRGPGGTRSIDVDDVVLTTPVPKMIGEPVLDSIGDKGRRPVLHTMDLGEDLLVTVRFELLDDDVDEVRPRLESQALGYKSARRVGPGEFEIRLHPAQAGRATGILRVPPMETSSKDVPPIKLEVNVMELKDRDDAGSRPRDVGEVRERLLRPVIAGIFRRRHHAVNNVYDQEKEKDPPPATPLWKTLLKTAVTLAINSVTAGLGAKIAGALISGSDGKPFTTELVKVLFEQGMATGSLAALEAKIEGSDGGPSAATSKQAGVPRRSMGITFRDAQEKALSEEAIVAEQRHLSTIENKVKRLEAEEPGSGFREALRLEAVLEENSEVAEKTQYIQTFQRWCSVLAANTLNTGKYDGPEANLKKSVDVDRVVRMPGEGGFDSEAIPGLSKTPGVLNLTLRENKRVRVRTGASEMVTHPYKVESAAISGLGSQDFRSTIKAIPIRELQMPIVAAFSDTEESYTPDTGFVIGRNEANQYWASELGGYLSVLTASRMGKAGKVDIKEAAEHIIMNEIGDETVEPRGA